MRYSSSSAHAATSLLLAAAVLALAAGCHKPAPPAPPAEAESLPPAAADRTLGAAAPSGRAPGTPAAPPAASAHYRLWQFGEVADALPAFMGYLRAQAESGAAERPYFFIILLDETGMALTDWGSMVKKAEGVVASMEPGEAAMVIGIDNDSRGREDVRVEVTSLPEETALAPTAKLALRQKVSALQQRSVVGGTDLLGAFGQAAHYASQKQNTHRIAVIGFTDLEPQDASGTMRVPSDDAGLAKDAEAAGSFPPGSEAGFFYVSTPNYEKLKQYWLAIFSRAGLNIDPLPAE